MYDKHKQETLDDLDKAVHTMNIENDIFASHVIDYDYDIDYRKDFNSAYDLMNLGLGIREMNNHTKTHERFFNELSKMGYNAIVDEFDNLIDYADLPIVVIDAKHSLTEKSKPRKITKKEYKKARDNY